MLGLNCGSGQRPFASGSNIQWVNLDINPLSNPDVLADCKDLSAWDNGTVDLVVSHHCLEHEQCGEGAGFVREAWRVLKPGGSLLVFVPDLRALAQRWLLGQLDTQVYLTNVYGPFDGTQGSIHRWGFDREHLHKFLSESAPWGEVKPFDWRQIEGMNAARDWHVLSCECVKG